VTEVDIESKRLSRLKRRRPNLRDTIPVTL